MTKSNDSLKQEGTKLPVKWTAPEALRDSVSHCMHCIPVCKSVYPSLASCTCTFKNIISVDSIFFSSLFHSEILQQVRCVEFWDSVVGDLLLWPCSLPKSGELSFVAYIHVHCAVRLNVGCIGDHDKLNDLVN